MVRLLLKPQNRIYLPFQEKHIGKQNVEKLESVITMWFLQVNVEILV